MAVIARRRRRATFDRFTGVNTVNGVFRVDGIASPGVICLYEKQTGQLIRRTIAGSDGQWVFPRVCADEWFVVGFPFAEKRATIVDGVKTVDPAQSTPPTPTVSARYWKISDLAVAGTYLEVGELELWDSTSKLAISSISSSSSPAGGDGGVGVLVDGSLSTRCYWSKATVDAGLEIVFDLGVPKSVSGFKESGYDTADRHISALKISYSDDGVSWSVGGYISGIAYPGNFTLTPLQLIDGASYTHLPRQVIRLAMEGVEGSVTCQDSSGWGSDALCSGGAAISSLQSSSGQTSLRVPGVGASATIDASGAFNVSSSYVLEASVYPLSLTSNFGIIHRGFYDNALNTWDGLSFSWRWIGGGSQFLRVYFYATTNANEQFVDIPGALVANQWKKIVAVKTGTTGRVYIDGVLRASVSGLLSPAPSTRSVKFGVWDYAGGAEHMDGFIDDVILSLP